MRLYYEHPGTAFGDCMPFFHDGQFYVYHQRDARDPVPFEPFEWSLATTTDFVDYEDRGVALPKGDDDAQDQYIFAGSVARVGDGFRAMYTAYNRDYAALGRPAQVLKEATSQDLLHWTKGEAQFLPPQPGYDTSDWRDPFPFWDEGSRRYVMILGARLEGDKSLLTGRTVWFTSPDFAEWTFQGDFWAPGLYTMHEMPDLFRMGDWWYLLTTEYSDRSTTVYRMSRSLEGPWSAPIDDAFDGRSYYAARTAGDGEHRYLFGWVASKEGETDKGSWDWGGTLVVQEVFQRADGSLGVRPPQGVLEAFSPAESILAAPLRLEDRDGRAARTLATTESDILRADVRLSVEEGTRSFALRLFEDPDSGDAYAFTFHVGEQRIDFDKVPNWPWFRYDKRGLDRPFVIEPGREYDVTVIVDDTIATLYVDGVALNARMYDKRGARLGVQVVDGAITIHEARLSTSLVTKPHR